MQRKSKLKTSDKSGNRRLINRYDWRKEQYCFHCGCRVYLDGLNKPDSATIDHIYPKIDIRRYCVNGSKNVLSCYKCNQNRDSIFRGNIKQYGAELGNLYELDILLKYVLELGHI